MSCAGDPAPAAPEPQDVSPLQELPSGSGCTTHTHCDDGVSCTQDVCESGTCQWQVAAGSCLIFGKCRGESEVDGCGICAPSASQTSWSPAPNGTVCNDDDPCTDTGFCAAGSCQTEPSTCDDKNDCTSDHCNEVTGCAHDLEASDTLCDTGSACFETGNCSDGACVAPPVACDDDNPCTNDTCDPLLGCAHVPDEGACDDDNACTGVGACTAGLCEAGAALDCDDDNSCTIDSCHPTQGCTHLATFSACCTGLVSVCDDGNACTTDSCDPVTKGCTYENNKVACDDTDACTSEDACTSGSCQGVPISCADGNDCSEDVCSPTEGCTQIPLSSGPCDDGLTCSTNDSCIGGECAGDVTDCVCVPEFSDTASKLISVALGTGGYAGEGLDVDNDPATCAPSNSCAGGINNAFSALSEIAFELGGVDINDEMAVNTEQGWVKLVVELRNFGTDSLQLAIYRVDLDPANPSCAFQTETCAYWVDPALVDSTTCAPLVLLPATLMGTTVVAGGPDTSLPFEIPFQGGITLKIVLHRLMFQGELVSDGTEVVSLTGILGAAILKEDLEDAILTLPAAALGGIDPATALPLLSLALEYDINVPNKGPAASIGLKVEGIGATLTGISP